MSDFRSHFGMSKTFSTNAALMSARKVSRFGWTGLGGPVWVDRFGTYFAHKIRKRRSESMRRSRQWQCHLNEVFVKIRGERHYLWRAVNHEGECWNPMSRRSGISLLRDIPKESNEAIRESSSSRHGQMIFLSGRNEGHRQ
jgi:hypothetical protein